MCYFRWTPGVVYMNDDGDVIILGVWWTDGWFLFFLDSTLAPSANSSVTIWGSQLVHYSQVSLHWDSVTCQWQTHTGTILCWRWVRKLIELRSFFPNISLSPSTFSVAFHTEQVLKKLDDLTWYSFFFFWWLDTLNTQTHTKRTETCILTTATITEKY